ncbi:hypothetical protein DFP72DRAFT_844767 [Ephemerocybe angulata]|uniref:Uncharacterized protein n=1 Tax=Ephemerocybe angulata TaxID=980116 RepID=A0A8H6I4Y4_9AGAR|nr:hypothetical protein DFP72DRAFT_844767 [Tulosesus angulatus]
MPRRKATTVSQKPKPSAYPKADSDSDDGSDSDAPEAVSLSQSKQAVQQKDADVRKAQLSAKEKEKEKRRDLDRKLKERAELTRGAAKKGVEAKSKEVKNGKGKGPVVEEESGSEDNGEESAEDDEEMDEGAKELEARISRKVRVLSTDAQPKTPLAAPSRKVHKFLDRALALKGQTSKPKLGWERRPESKYPSKYESRAQHASAGEVLRNGNYLEPET